MTTKYLTHNSVWEVDEGAGLYLRYPREDATHAGDNDVPYGPGPRWLEFDGVEGPSPLHLNVFSCGHHHVRMRLLNAQRADDLDRRESLKFDPIIGCPNDTDGDGDCAQCAPRGGRR